MKVIVDIYPCKGEEKKLSPAEMQGVCDDMSRLVELSKFGVDSCIEVYPVPFDYQETMSQIADLEQKIDNADDALSLAEIEMQNAKQLANQLVKKFEDA